MRIVAETQFFQLFHLGQRPNVRENAAAQIKLFELGKLVDYLNIGQLVAGITKDHELGQPPQPL